MMTIDEAIIRYTDNAEYERTHGNLQGCLNFKQLAELLTELKQRREQTNWIPVSEKMPSIAQRVLVSATNGEVFIARYHSFDKWTFEPTGISYAYNKDSIVAWMPLPQSYKVESGDKE